MYKICRVLMISSMLLGCSVEENSKQKLNLQKDSITVSGISSGGYMAHQFHIAYSDLVNGAALLASGPFGCARGDLQIALAECVNSESPPTAESLMPSLKEAASRGDIAPLENLQDDKVWILHGTQDSRVSRKVTEVQQALYENLSVKVDTQYELAVGHGFPTVDSGVACGASESPHINQCNFDGAGEIFKVLYGEINSKTQVTGELVAFDQGQSLDEGRSNTLADTGYLYVPTACRNGEVCRIHIAFHGCSQNVDSVERSFVENAGYNAWAESNRVVVIYPQTKSSYMPLNPKACWDWWGYTGADYQSRNGAQLKQIYNMVTGL
jgi:poly(3-hydroxybutyrate) depolymerase